MVNASAYNNADGAEGEFETACEINAFGFGNLAKAANSAKISFIHITNYYVFSCAKQKPYIENDKPNPINKYGQSKLMGGEITALECQYIVILCTAWVFSRYSNNFVKAMLSLAANGKTQLCMVEYQIGFPTCARDLARNIFLLPIDCLINHKIMHYPEYFMQRPKTALAALTMRTIFSPKRANMVCPLHKLHQPVRQNYQTKPAALIIAC